MMRFDFADKEIGAPYSQDDVTSLHLMRHKVKRIDDGRIKTPLLLRNSALESPYNRDTVLRRMEET